MGKIIKMNSQPKKDMDFEKFVKELSKDQLALFEQFNIKSFEDMYAFTTALGIDIEKMLDYYDNKPVDVSDDVPLEHFLMNEDHPLYHSSILSKENDDEFYDNEDDDEDYEDYDDEDYDGEDYDGEDYLPERIFIGGKTTEYHIRIKLKDAPLPIWRELKLPSNITLEAFSCIIIEAMGWDDTHLHKFKKGESVYMSTQELAENDYFMPFDEYNYRDSNDWSLEQVLMEKGDRMEYEYDFGDSWKHEIWVKGIREYAPDETPGIIVIKGKGACPPEDCGGVWGYAELLRIYEKKRKTKEEKERLEWYWMDSYFDPEEYEVDEYQPYLDDLWKMMTNK